MIGYINSVETMGLVDGPGIRFVVFMQGCPNRCIFCHNPETWKIEDGIKETPENLLKQILKYKNYYGDTGGVTISGGEPLLQKKFLLEVLKLCKENNINTCLDTSGIGNNYEEVLKYVDLIILDIKAINQDSYHDIVKNDFNKFLDFINVVNKNNKKLWIRQVIIPGINDNTDYMDDLSLFIKKIKNVLKVELLPFHTFGFEKYKKLNINNPLLDTLPMDIKRCNELQEYLRNKLK